MDIEDQLAVERFELEAQRKRVSLEDFQHFPFRHLAKVRECEGEIYLTNEDKVSFVVMDAKKYFTLLDDYFRACLKAGTLDPRLAKIVQEDELLKNPHGSA